MVDFERLASSLLARSDSLLPAWLPGGKRSGNEFVCGNLAGEPGGSLSINVKTGRWADFAADVKGGDLISLYAAIHGISNLDAAKELDSAGDYQSRSPINGAHRPMVEPRKPVVIEEPAERPPADAGEPQPHHKFGPHAALYAYRDKDGLIGYVARYETPEGKTFSPWRWLGGKWQAKSLPKPRPMYGLERLQANPKAQVLIVEGEKCVDAAVDLLKPMCVICWSGGAQAVEHVDFAPLAGRKVDLWPDNDEPGRKAMARVGEKLLAIGAQVRIVNPEGQPEKWDLADAIADGWDQQRIVKWITRENKRFLVSITEPAPGAPPAVSPTVDLPSAEAGASFPASAIVAPQVADLILDPRAGNHPSQIWNHYGLDTTVNNGTPPANEDTVNRILSRHPGVFWFDAFLQRAMTTLGGTAPRPLEDADYAQVLIWLQSAVRLHRMSLRTVISGLAPYLRTHQRNCAQEWMRSLKWDGTQRLNLLLPLGFGTRDDEYNRKVGRNIMMQMVHRVMEPGCQADYMPILEGGQGKFKSTALRILGSPYFTESHVRIDDKDFLQQLPGKMLIEISELTGFTKSQIEAVKGIITNRVDRYRPSYGRIAADYPRQCVFAGTTNSDNWNQDVTGARRFWRVLCGKIDHGWILENRDQMIAEALVLVDKGEEHYIVPGDEARRLQDEARDDDIWRSAIEDYIAGKPHVKPEDILCYALATPVERQSKESANRVRNVLRQLGWISGVYSEGGKSKRAWMPPRIPKDEAAPSGPGEMLN